MVLVVAWLALPMPARASDCGNATNQNEMNRCAEDAFNSADRALNAQYKLTRKAMGDDAEADRLLVAAQRAWIAFRDAHCAVVSFPNQGGSLEPLTRSSCMAEVTRARTKQLKELASDYGQ
jgi:uncharacterized protein YecT (DUF1311 family)